MKILNENRYERIVLIKYKKSTLSMGIIQIRIKPKLTSASLLVHHNTKVRKNHQHLSRQAVLNDNIGHYVLAYLTAAY